MLDEPLPTLSECSEFRQTLQARPPRIVHGTIGLCIALLASALTWSAATDADLVVRLTGRVRPVTSPQQVMVALGGEVRTLAEGRVVAVYMQPGDEVRQGQLLIQLDTKGLDNEIAKRQRTIRDGEAELIELDQLLRLAQQQHTAARARAEAELTQAREEVRQAKDRQAVEVRLVRLEKESATDEVRRLRQLAGQQATTSQDLFQGQLKVREAEEKLTKALLPVSEGRGEVLARVLEQLDKDDAVKRKELDLKRRTRQSEVEAARSDLVNLDLQRQQASLRAPCDGVVTSGEVKVGDLLDRGKPVFEIAAQQGFRFEGTISSAEVAHLRVGLPVRIKLDALDVQRYGTLAGTVSFIAPDSRPGESGQPAQYLVRIDLESNVVGRAPWCAPVKLGMAGEAEIVTGQESLLALLVKRVRQSISLH
jgi:hemolysin D